jgi:hypothetical protein
VVVGFEIRSEAGKKGERAAETQWRLEIWGFALRCWIEVSPVFLATVAEAFLASDS